MEPSFRKHALIGSAVLLATTLLAGRAAGQEPLCACISAWQQGKAAPANCPRTDSSGIYDRSAKSYVLYAGPDAAAQANVRTLLAALKVCAGNAYQVRTDYDQVQMSDVYSFLPAGTAAAPGAPAAPAPKMELSVKSRATSSAVLLKITGAAPIPGGEPAFVAATGAWLKEWETALAEKKSFSGPKAGWAALYPAARYAGADGAVGKYETGSVYRYEWRAAAGDAEALQQGLVQALAQIPGIRGSGSYYNNTVPGKSSVAGYRLLPPNPPVRIETAVDFAEQAGVVRLSIIVPDGKKAP